MVFTVQVSDHFAVGDTVKAYPESNWRPDLLQPDPGSLQVGAAADSAVVAQDGTVTFTELVEDAVYYLTVDGSGSYVRIRPDVIPNRGEPGADVNRMEIPTSTMPGDTADERYAAALATAYALGREGGRVLFDQHEQFTASYAGVDIPDNITLDVANGGWADMRACTTVGAEFFPHKGTEGTHYMLTTDAASGSTTVTLSPADAAALDAALTGNRWVVLGSEQKFDPLKTGQPLGEFLQVLSIDTSTGVVTFTTGVFDGTGYLSGDVSGKRAFVAAVTMAQGLKVTPAFKAVGGGAARRQIGFACDRAERPLIQGDLSEFEDKAVYFYGCVFPSVDGAHIADANYSSRGYGVMFAFGTQDGSLAGSVINGCRHGVTFGGSPSRAGVARRISIEGNWFYDSRSTGDTVDTHAGCEHIWVTGNWIYDSARNGINFECPKASAAGNHIFRPARHGISWIPYSDEWAEVSIKDNDIHDPAIAGIRATTSKKNNGAGGNIRWLQIEGNHVYSPASYGIQVDRYDPAFRWKNVRVQDNVVYSPQAPNSYFFLGFDDSTVHGNKARDCPGNHIAFKFNDCQRVRDAGQNFSFHTDITDALAPTLGANFTAGATTMLLSSTAGLSSRGSLSIDGIDYSYGSVTDGTHLGGVKATKAATLLADLSDSALVANMDAAPTTTTIVLDTEVLTVTAVAQNADEETWDVTVTRTVGVAHTAGTIAYYGKTHLSGATVSFSYGAGSLFVACSDFSAIGSGADTALYGTRADNDCTHYVLDERPSRNTTQAARLGTGVGGVLAFVPSTSGLGSAQPTAAAENKGQFHYATDQYDLSRSSGSSYSVMLGRDIDWLLRVSECRTPYRPSANLTLVAGVACGFLVNNRKAQAYTGMRVRWGGTLGTLTELRLGVWDASDGTVIADSGDIKANVNVVVGKSRVMPITVPSQAKGKWLRIGLAFTQSAGTTQVRGESLLTEELDVATLESTYPIAAAQAYAGGALPTLASTVAGAGWGANALSLGLVA